MQTLLNFFSIFRNADLFQKAGTAVSVALAAAITLSEVLPRIIDALRAISAALSGTAPPA